MEFENYYLNKQITYDVKSSKIREIVISKLSAASITAPLQYKKRY